MKPSVLGNISNFTIGDTITIPITKYNSSYSDTLNIYVGTTFIKRVQGITNNQKISFTDDEKTACYNAMPYVTGASFRFVNTTYNGANVVGTSENVATGTIPKSVKPAITKVEMREYINGIDEKFGGYVQYRSQIYCNITAEPGTGTGIYGYSGNIGNSAVMDNPRITNYLDKSGTNNYSLTVTDQRYRNATTTGTFNVLAYDNPKINSFSVERCNQNGTPNLYGDYVKVNASAEISSVNNKNDKSFKIQYKLRSDSTWTDLLTYADSYTYTLNDSIHSGFSVDNVYDFRLLVSDYFESIEKRLNISAGFAIIDLYKTGKGISFGKVSTKEAMEIGYDMYDKFDTKINNGLSVYRTGNVDIDPDETLEELILTETNTPESGFWYVRTMFYENKSITSNRTQIAYPYNNLNSSPYHRIYYNGVWSDWISVSSQVNAMDYEGYFKAGKQLIQAGWVSITPTAANVPTTVRVNFNNTYKYAPNVILTVSSGVSETEMLGCSTNGVTKTYANIVLTRNNTISTSVKYLIIGEVE